MVVDGRVVVVGRGDEFEGLEATRTDDNSSFMPYDVRQETLPSSDRFAPRKRAS